MEEKQGITQKLKKRYLKDYPDYRFQQAKKALFERGIESWDEATALPADLRDELSEKIPLEIPARCLCSGDGSTEKAIINLEDGLHVEAVLMKHDENRNTVCVSTQVGCPLGCKFCATGRMGYERDLTAGEMIDQVLYFLRRLPDDQRVDNVVFMGMGEPFLNYEETLAAVRLLNEEEGFNIGARNISISTAGLPDKIRRFGREDLQVNLAVSLHGAVDQTRSQLMPVNRKYPLGKLLEAVDDYIEMTNRKVMFEYILFKGVNDSRQDMENLQALLEGRLHYLNLIPYNPTGSLEGVSEEKLQEFKTGLKKRGLQVGIRRSFGQNIEGACGQLATEQS